MSNLPRPVPYSRDVEQAQPDEERTIDALNAVFNDILETTSRNYGHAVRSVHAKSHGVLEGSMTILDGLAPELAQGLFAKPGTKRVFLRLSTNAGDVLPDAISLPRGLAMKVLDVEGPRLEDAEGATQDFVMVNGPVFQTRTADKFLSNLRLIAKTTDRAEGAKVVLSTVLRATNKALTAMGMPSKALQSLGGAPNVDPLGETYFSVTPFRYGEHMAKFAIRPVSPDLTTLTGREIDASADENAIRNTVRNEMKAREGRWEFCVQLCRDLDKQPIEDPTVAWDEKDAPLEVVAITKATPQDSWDEARVRAVDEEMRFSVWTGLEAHRPLGNINRARREPYRQSAAFRSAFNRCPIHEPAGA